MNSLPPNTPATPRIITPEFIEELRKKAETRTFGLADTEYGRLCVRHGYLLALEEVMSG